MFKAFQIYPRLKYLFRGVRGAEPPGSERSEALVPYRTAHSPRPRSQAKAFHIYPRLKYLCRGPGGGAPLAPSVARR